MTPLRIIYVGPLWKGSTCLQRMEALQDLGHSVRAIDTEPRGKDGGTLFKPSLISRVRRRVLNTLGKAEWYPWDGGANAALLRESRQGQYDILWIDKALSITADTLERFKQAQPACKIVGYSPDDMFRVQNQSRQFLEHLHLYDIFLTTKSYNVQELRSLGCNRPVFINQGFCPAVHRPVSVMGADRVTLGGAVGFIGAFEPERGRSIWRLAKAGIQVRVWGGGWQRRWYRHKDMHIEGKSLWGEDYARAICSFDVNLCFLRKANRDLHTTRSIEIPACGAFMLAERTQEHQGLFQEGVEAEFFSSDQELIEKVRFYLVHEAERKRISQAGRERCIRSGYDYPSLLEGMLKEALKSRGE